VLVRIVDDHGLAAAGWAAQHHAQVVLHEQFDDQPVAHGIYRVHHLVRVIYNSCIVRLPLILLLSDLYFDVPPFEIIIKHEID